MDMSKEQIERYLNILEEKNRIAERVEEKMMDMTSHFDVWRETNMALRDIGAGLIYIGDEIARQKNY